MLGQVAANPPWFFPMGFLFVGLFILLSFILWIAAIVDVIRREFPDPNTKLLWLLIILLSHGIGALLYFLFGRAQGRQPRRL